MGIKQVALIVVFLIILSSIPLSLYLVKQSQTLRSRAFEPTLPPRASSASASAGLKLTPTGASANSSLSQLQKLLQNQSSLPTETSPSASPNQIEALLTLTPSPQVSFGPNLSLTVSLEGRPSQNQSAKVFVGIAAGTPMPKPAYLLSFTVDIGPSGEYDGLSLAGLTVGSNYTAYIKGPAQIATASAFTLGPSINNLNNHQALILTSGDLNDDNTINSADYTIAKASFGTTSSSANWNSLADFNLDGIINNLDLGIINKNMGKSGLSGTWYSPPPSTTSAVLKSSPLGGSSGHWLWVP